MPEPLLKVEKLNAWYGHAHVLQGVSFEVHKGEIVTLMGRNGAGKTTSLRAIMGLIPKRSGNVLLAAEPILAAPSFKRFHLGLGYVPEDRRIVPGLTVQENIRLGLVASPRRRRETEIIERIAKTFPRLKQRLHQQADSLSGGEQQMLAIARALASDPKLVMMDEPSEGIMPVLIDEMFELFLLMKKAGTTILLVEQNVERALEVSDRAYIMDQGLIVHEGIAQELLADKAIQERYCSV
jgi:branched-chain amino acid transport system ATP-binding protein